MGLPSKLTEEEEALLAKFALIKKKKKAQSTKTSHTNKVESKPSLPVLPLKREPAIDTAKSSKILGTKKEVPPPTKVPIAPKDAKEKAKQLLASGQLKIGKDNEVRSFKRARVSSNPEKKSDATSGKSQMKKTLSSKTLVDPSDHDLSDLDDDKDKATNSSNNFSNKHSIHNKPYIAQNDTEEKQKNSFDNNNDTRHNFDNRNRFDNYNNRGRGRGRGNHHFNNNNYRQNNLFVSGYDLSKELLERAFTPFGDIKTIYCDQDRGRGFVTYFNNECAAAAIEALHGEMVENKILCVVYARPRQNYNKFDDNRYTYRAGRNNRPPTDPERPRDLDSVPGETSKLPRAAEDRISGKSPEMKERKLVNYNDNIITYDHRDFEF